MPFKSGCYLMEAVGTKQALSSPPFRQREGTEQ